MAIVIEGLDNSGKSTLALMLARFTSFQIVESEGPPKYDGEMFERLERYAQMSSRTIFVRHPCVSQVIYGTMRGDPPCIPQTVIDRFYTRNHLFIYCDPLDRGLGDHVIKEGVDTEAHLKAIKEQYSMLLFDYRMWAIKHAKIMYRIGDNMRDIEQLARAVVRL